MRIAKTVNGVKHTYVLDGIKILREKYSDVTLNFLYGVEEDIVGFTYNNVPYYYRKNLQGDIIGIVDSNGELIATYEYKAWGKLLSVTGNTLIANINPIRYRSYYYDTETQLYYLNSRYYDPDTCRFINADKANIILTKKLSGKNLYLYCENNPITYRDETGDFIHIIFGAVLGALVNGVSYLLSIILSGAIEKSSTFKKGIKEYGKAIAKYFKKKYRWYKLIIHILLGAVNGALNMSFISDLVAALFNSALILIEHLSEKTKLILIIVDIVINFIIDIVVRKGPSFAGQFKTFSKSLIKKLKTANWSIIKKGIKYYISQTLTNYIKYIKNI